MLATGRRVFLFDAKEGRTENFLFLNPQEGKAGLCVSASFSVSLSLTLSVSVCLGTLFWCGLGQREQNAARSLPLHTLTDIYTGKQTPVFKSAAAQTCPDERY